MPGRRCGRGPCGPHHWRWGPFAPLYPIGTVARIVGVHPKTIRLYESLGLVRPGRRRGRRLFSWAEVVWLQCLRRMIHQFGPNVRAVQTMLRFAPCWAIMQCPPQVRLSCPVYQAWAKWIGWLWAHAWALPAWPWARGPWWP